VLDQRRESAFFCTLTLFFKEDDKNVLLQIVQETAED
jgi:hypothetical protein